MHNKSSLRNATAISTAPRRAIFKQFEKSWLPKRFLNCGPNFFWHRQNHPNFITSPPFHPSRLSFLLPPSPASRVTASGDHRFINREDRPLRPPPCEDTRRPRAPAPLFSSSASHSHSHSQRHTPLVYQVPGVSWARPDHTSDINPLGQGGYRCLRAWCPRGPAANVAPPPRHRLHHQMERLSTLGADQWDFNEADAGVLFLPCLK